MWPFRNAGDGGDGAGLSPLALFPLKTVLFPGGVLPIKVFEQRYIDMAKRCLKEARPFGVCLITQGEEVALDRGTAPEIANVGTLARIVDFDMPELGILHLSTLGQTRFQVRSPALQPSGLLTAEVVAIPAEPAKPVAESFLPLVNLLELIAARVGPQNFPAEHAYEDASWVGYRLAELLPLPLPIKQSMLEINDAGIRLQVLQKFLTQQRVL
jgi:hypothetical protein